MFYNREDSKYEGNLIRLRDWQVGGWTKMKKRWTVGKKSVLVWFNKNVAVGQLYSLERNFFSFLCSLDSELQLVISRPIQLYCRLSKLYGLA